MGLCASIASSRALGTREGTCTTATTLTPAPAFHRSRTYPSSAVHRDVDAHSETALTKLGFELVLAPRLPGRPNEPRNNTATLRRYPRISTIPYDPRWNLKWRKIVPKYLFHQRSSMQRQRISFDPADMPGGGASQIARVRDRDCAAAASVVARG
jgi:hypothetical protein